MIYKIIFKISLIIISYIIVIVALGILSRSIILFFFSAFVGIVLIYILRKKIYNWILPDIVKFGAEIIKNTIVDKIKKVKNK